MGKRLPTMWETRVQSLGWEDLLEKEMAVFLPGESHGWRSLIGYSPRGHKESDTTEWLHFHLVLYSDRCEQMYNDMCLSLGIIQRFFSALKVLCAPHIHPTSPPLITYLGNHWSFYHLHNFTFFRMSYSWKYTINIILIILYVDSWIGFFHLVICF